jgi:hypothetical protein
MLTNPGINSTSIDESTLPGVSTSIPIPNKGKDRALDTFEDIPIGPQELTFQRPLSPSSTGSITPRQEDFGDIWTGDNPFAT